MADGNQLMSVNGLKFGRDVSKRRPSTLFSLPHPILFSFVMQFVSTIGDPCSEFAWGRSSSSRNGTKINDVVVMLAFISSQIL
jgi:hypothetical protein